MVIGALNMQKTLPCTLANTTKELEMVYSLLCSLLTRGDCDLSLCTDTFLQTLTRVALSISGRRHQETFDNPQENVYSLLERIFGLISFKRQDVVEQLCISSALSSLVLVRNQKFDLAAKTCHLVQDALKKLQKDPTKRLKLPPTLAHQEHHHKTPLSTKEQTHDDETTLYVKEMCQIIQSVCCLHQQKSSDARQILEEVRNDSWHPYCVYMKAYCHYTECDSESSLAILRSLSCTRLNSCSVPLRVKYLNLAAMCLSREGKHEGCIEKLRESLATDFTHLHSLYLLSLEYDQLGQVDPHLEALNLLNLALEKQHSKCDTTPLPTRTSLSQVIEDVILSCDQTQCTVHLHHAQYLLASACLRHKRYENALRKYKQLIEHLKNASHITPSKTDVITLPTMHQIYSEACLSALRCGHYDDSITIATDILDQSSQRSESIDELADSFLSGCSRKRGIFSNNETLENTNQWEAKLLTYKADSLLQLEQCEPAITSLTRAIEIHETLINQTFADPPLAKSLKVDEPAENLPLADTAELVDCYCMMGSIHHKLKQNKSALHYYRLALQVQPDYTKAMYNTTAMLTQMGRVKEAVIGWLQFRGTNHRMDSFQLGNEIRRKKQQIKILKENNETEDSETHVSEEKLLNMDLTALNQLMHHT